MNFVHRYPAWNDTEVIARKEAMQQISSPDARQAANEELLRLELSIEDDYREQLKRSEVWYHERPAPGRMAPPEMGRSLSGLPAH